MTESLKENLVDLLAGTPPKNSIPFVRIDCIAVGIGAINIFIVYKITDIVFSLIQCKLYVFMDNTIIGRIASVEFAF